LTKDSIFPLFSIFSASSQYTFTSFLMIKIRLQRHGARHSPFYRMVVAPSTVRRDGKFIEVLGTYNPQAHARTEELKLKMDRIDHWLGVGAQPTDTAKSLIRQGRLSPEEWLERAEKKASSKLARAKKSAAPVLEDAPAEEAKSEEPAAKEEAPAEEAKSEEPAAKEEAPAEEVKSEEPAAKEVAPAEEAKSEEPAAEDSSEEDEKKEDAKES
jgi:small subunit ribosomal protein S16